MRNPEKRNLRKSILNLRHRLSGITKPLASLVLTNHYINLLPITEKSPERSPEPKHEGKNLKRPENAETEVIHIEVPDTIKNSKEWYPEGENLYKRLTDYRDSVLFFTTHPEVDYTNNLSERCCRNYKRKRQQMVTHRSQEAAENLCKALSILLTERFRGENLYAKTKEYFKGTSTP